MLDFSFVDPRLLFPHITESYALMIENAMSVLYILSLAMMIVGEWMLFKKFGEKPWKSLIPYYNTYIMYKRTWNKYVFWVYLLTSVLFNLAQTTSKSLAQRFPGSSWTTLILLIALPLGIVAAVCSILFAFRTAEVFGKNKLFSVGLLVLYPIFVVILGFGRSKYVAPSGKLQSAGVSEMPETKAEVV